MSRIGQMRKRIIIQSRVDLEEGDSGQANDRATVATVWAKVTNVTGTAQVDSRNAGEGVSHRFEIRYRTDVTKQNEIIYDSKRFEIATIQVEKDERDRFLIIDANELDVVGTLEGITLSSVALSGSATPASDSTEQYTLTATYSDSSTGDVSESAVWAENNALTTIAGGLLTIGTIPDDQACTIFASYAGLSDTLTVTLQKEV